MKKWILTFGILFTAFTLSSSSVPVSATKEKSILLNYKDTGLSVNQVILEGTTLVPLRSLAPSMGYTLTWNQTTKIAKLIRPEREVIFTMGSTVAKVNGSAVSLTKTPRILNGAMYVPLVSAVGALGGKIGYNNSDGNLHIVDKPRFIVSSTQGRTYWVSQKNGDVYYLASVPGTPELIGELPLSESPYSHQLEIKEAGNGTDLLLLNDNHYAMFNDFTNSYQALIQHKEIQKKMEYHFVTSSYMHTPQLKTTQLYMTDGRNVQYITQNGSLGKLFELEKITGHTGDFMVEYVADDVVLVRAVDTTQLFAINATTGESTNLSLKLIRLDDQKEWNQADSRDPNVLSKMLILKKRTGNDFTFTYTPLPEGKVQTVIYTLISN
ncbi:copper amine oxidase N-terminal domain-containing protein [Paenibacillus sp. FA6]|uniref:copper amine oxidase N-terminal domain-containing protein n=1 Tax=Paenibacillus sp. FA6 TaxID=3413029 RepID=UPI003F65ECB2